jgi:hypothetical protein
MAKKKKNKQNDLQNTTQKTEDWVTRTPPFERIDKAKERTKTDIRVTTCNPFKWKFNNPFERE